MALYISEDQKKSGITNVKSSYHVDGRTHMTVQVPILGNIDDDAKRNTGSGLGFNGDKVYSVSEKNVPLSEIDDVTRFGQGGSFSNINTIPSHMLKVVSFEDIKWGSEIVDPVSTNIYL